MASQFGVAGGIPERRVRPVWDAIESRQFKNALKLIASVLSKYPSSPYALALKALVLERTGKCDDALSVCLAAKELLLTSDPLLMDDLTLSTLQIVLQRLDHLELATSCYENACAKFPKNLELMMGLFNCYVREYSFVKQQQTAIKMYKIVGEERFLLWAVCSIQLQVLCGNGEEKLLSLAEGLLKKHIASHSLHEPEALIVYISLLEQQAKYCDAFEVLCGKLGSLIIIEVDKLRMQGRLLARSGDYAAAALIFQKVLESCPDDWGCFLHYLSCLLEDDNSWCNLDVNDPIHPPKCVNCQFSHLTNDSFLSRISDALAFVQKLQAETNNDGIRGPYLAYLEIGRRKRLYGKEDDGSLVDALVQYFSRFGHLACFLSDLEEFLQDLYPDEKTELIEQLWKCCNSSTTQPTEVLGRSISLLKVEQLIGDMFKLSMAELYISVTEMLQLYCKTLALSKDLDPQESMYGEELLSMACNTLVQLFWRTGNLGYLLEAVIILEFGLTIRGCIWQYKILALHLYSYLGAFKLAYEWYKSLDVKNILLETVSHHIFRQLLTSPLWADLDNLYNDYLRFMDDHLRESADLTFLAYRHRSYSKVVEFVQFKQRLERSNQYLLAKIESPILHLKQNADNVEEEEHVLESLQYGVPFIQLSSEIGSRSLTFNEDLQSRPWWTPTPEENHLSGPFKRVSYRPKENLTEERERNARKTIEKRSLLPRMIHLSIQCAAAASLRENVEDNGTTSADLKFSTEMKSLLERYANILGYTFGDAIETITGVSSGTTSAEVLGEDAIDWTNFAVFLNAWNLASREHGLRTWHIFNSLSENLIGAKLRSTGTIISANGSDLAHLFQMITEPLAWHGLVLQTCVRSILPSGKKKKKTGAADHSNSELCRAVQASLESVNETVEEVMKWLRERRLENDALDFMLSFLQQKEGTEGPGRVFQLLVDFTSFMDETEVGARIFENLKLWSPLDAVRKTAADKCAVLSMFLNICESKYKFLRALRQQMAAHSHT